MHLAVFCNCLAVIVDRHVEATRERGKKKREKDEEEDRETKRVISFVTVPSSYSSESSFPDSFSLGISRGIISPSVAFAPSHAPFRCGHGWPGRRFN